MLLWHWESYFVLLNEEIHFVLVLIEEWRDAHEHFVEQDAQGPPVNRVVMSISVKHLRRKVLGCTAKTSGQLPIANLGCQTEVSQEQVSISVEENVLWL